MEIQTILIIGCSIIAGLVFLSILILSAIARSFKDISRSMERSGEDLYGIMIQLKMINESLHELNTRIRANSSGKSGSWKGDVG